MLIEVILAIAAVNNAKKYNALLFVNLTSIKLLQSNPKVYSNRYCVSGAIRN